MCKIDYKREVWQGDNMASILFPYIMQATIESLHPKLTCNIPNYKYFPSQENATKWLYGRLDLQPNLESTRKSKSSFPVNNLLDVDDGAFLLEALDELKVASQNIHPNACWNGWTKIENKNNMLSTIPFPSHEPKRTAYCV